MLDVSTARRDLPDRLLPDGLRPRVDQCCTWYRPGHEH